MSNTKSTYQILFFVLMIFGSVMSFGQEIVLTGEVKTEDGDLLPNVKIEVIGVSKRAKTNLDGKFKLTFAQAGLFTLQFSFATYKTQEVEVALKPGEQNRITVILHSDRELETVTVIGKSKAEEKANQGFEVAVIKIERQQNLNADINQVLKSTPGINIRQSGGLGSGFALSLNGLGGNQIRYFIDGIPMENFGTALSLNNYPVNLIKQVEVYKGVVPIGLSGDALGGAINIITGNQNRSFLDASYAVGSFNTHRVALNAQYVGKKGYGIRLSSFFNHSANNYQMDSVSVYDLELGNGLGQHNVKRFHDQYTSGMTELTFFVNRKKWTDRTRLRFIGAANRKNHQHSDNNLKRVFNHFHTRNQTAVITADYLKKLNRLTLKGYAAAGQIVTTVVDTSREKYNWLGDFVVREPDDAKGELFERRSLFVQTDFILRSNLSAAWKLNKNNEVEANFSQQLLQRQGKDEIDVLNRSFETPGSLNKYIAGLGYNLSLYNDKIRLSPFGKGYLFTGKIVTTDAFDNTVTTKPAFGKLGYGVALAYQPLEALQLKGSMEKAYRLPESYELLGDGIYVQPNAGLQPETSLNLNSGAAIRKKGRNIQAIVEVNGFYRRAANFIRFKPTGPFGQYENLTATHALGAELGVDLRWKEKLFLQFNLTYQHLTDQAEFDEGIPNVNYKSRVPNVPWFFSNIKLGMAPFSTPPTKPLKCYWTTRYVHAFFLTWENAGDAGSKYIIPAQLVHNFEVEYALKEGGYNFSAGVYNLTNAVVFDNFSIQKPGRTFALKLRYKLLK